MNRRVAAVLLTVLCTCAMVLAQAGEQDDLDRVAAEQQVGQKVQRFLDMGMEPEAATFMAILTETGMSPAEIMVFMMMADKGGDDAGGIMLLMNAMKGAASSQPVVVDRGEELLIIDDGVLYVIDMTTMEVTGRLDYAEAAGPDDDAIWQLLVPIIAEGGGEEGGPQGAACRQHLKQIGLAFMMYAQDNNGALPGQDWVEAITPYLETEDSLRCPAHPELAVGYAMNEKLVGAILAEVTEPGETILLFDTDLDAANPVGGPGAVPQDGIHGEGVNVVYADGRVEWVRAPEAWEVLGLPIDR